MGLKPEKGTGTGKNAVKLRVLLFACLGFQDAGVNIALLKIGFQHSFIWADRLVLLPDKFTNDARIS